MKVYLTTCIIILIGFLYSFTYGSTTDSAINPMPLDDEQNGLGEQIVINFSHVVAENTPKGLAAQRFASLVKEKTNGKVKVEVFPNGILYSDGEEVDALLRGDVEMIAPAYSKITNLFPEWQVLDLPFVFRSHEDIEEAFTGDIGTTLLDILQTKNIKGLSLWSNGFKQMTSSKGPLVEPEDFRGQRFRIMPSEAINEQFKMLDALPREMAFNKVYKNLENRMLDGQENTLSNIWSKRFYHVQNYLTVSNHGYLGYAVIMNDEYWSALPKDVQKAILESIEETRKWLLQHSIVMNNQQLENIRNFSSIEIHELTEEEKQLWIKEFEPIYKKFEPVIGEKLMKQVEKLHEAREEPSSP